MSADLIDATGWARLEWVSTTVEARVIDDYRDGSIHVEWDETVTLAAGAARIWASDFEAYDDEEGN